MRICIHTPGEPGFYALQLQRALLGELHPEDDLLHCDGATAWPVTPLRLGAQLEDVNRWDDRPLPARLKVAQAVGTWWSGRCSEQAGCSHQADVSHAIGVLPHPNCSTPVIPLVRDLGPRRHPDAFGPCSVSRFERFLAQIDAYPVINTLSQCSKNELVAETGIDAGRIVVTGIGVDDAFRIGPRAQDELELQAIGLLAGDFFLTAGTLHGLCNIRRLTDAYAALPDRLRAWLPLVVVGSTAGRAPKLSREAQAEVEAGNIRLLGQVPQSLLGVLYRGARLAAFPATYGGVGLRVAEALVSGTPVAVSRDTPAAELAGPLATAVDPLDVDAWRLVLADHAGRGRFLRARALAEDRFRWRDVARGTIQLYQRVVRKYGALPQTPPGAKPLDLTRILTLPLPQRSLRP